VAIVEHAGSSYIARRSDPGAPGDGDGWRLLAAKGERGERGQPGFAVIGVIEVGQR
jgi:hypothetical protein